MSDNQRDKADEESSTDSNEGLAGFVNDPSLARRYLMWMAVALLALLAVVATFRVYTGASAAIGQFVAPDFRPLFQAAFNLVVLLLAVSGITLLLRELQAAT